MDSLPNSRKLNGISLVECLENKVTDKESQFPVLVRSPRIDQSFVKRYRHHHNNLVSKSLKSLFKKLTGTSSSANSTTNKSLSPSPTKEKMILVPSRSSHSKFNNSSVSRSITTNDSNFRRRVSSSYRHTLDLSYTIQDFQAKPAISIRRANSLCNTSSIYSTFSTAKSAASSITSSSSCIEMPNNHVENTTETSEIDHVTLQKRLWAEDQTLCLKEEIAEWLGSKSETRTKVLYLYMNNFDFANIRLDEAFRALCSKLYLKGESQQLDRIIEAFAKRYFECNPTTILHCVDVVYAVSYSLLLLNTDLHVVADWANRMTRNSFVKNTMETIHSLVFPHLEGEFSKLRKRRASIISYQSSSSDSLYQLESASLEDNTIINKLDALKSNISWKSSNDGLGLTRVQKHWLGDIESLLKDMYAAVKSHRIDQAKKYQGPEINAGNLYRSRTLPKNELGKSQSFRRRRGQSVISPLDTKVSLPTHELKHGLVMRKHVMESTDKRARHRQWQLCYLVMNDTELIMHRAIHVSHQQPTFSDHKARRRRSMMLWNQSVCSLQDIISQEGGIEDWQPDEKGTPLGKLEMNHSYTCAIPPPGWNGQRPHVFRMETAEGGLWLFESMDMFAVQAWVEAANATAAKISKGPLTGAVCNIDYGWGSKWDNTTREFTTENVPVWFPPTPCMVDSTLDLRYQYYDLETQIGALNMELDHHRELNGNQHGLNTMQALTNWDRKLHHLLHELVKLKCYKDSIYPIMTIQ
ncbi:hypothetical protein INT48_003438 [Thamnidium elegans]|uniref:SEC7 domain-containing protein n=1 Tax=Thamnidium elegans TaxID=101142 RepID=A0A8H7SUB8_9FUNG|nr:hypothetical protein INT48_003438 [Thamnidium elegans]